jgi:hypothetical protein
MGMHGLPDWAGIEPLSAWPVLLAGNCASREVPSVFDYSSLFDVADLSAPDRALFAEAQTENLEEVSRTLQLAAYVAEQVGMIRTDHTPPRSRASRAHRDGESPPCRLGLTWRARA